jgi:uncharacterized membrane protein
MTHGQSLRWFIFLIVWAACCVMGWAWVSGSHFLPMLAWLPVFGVLSAVLYGLIVEGPAATKKVLQGRLSRQDEGSD